MLMNLHRELRGPGELGGGIEEGRELRLLACRCPGPMRRGQLEDRAPRTGGPVGAGAG